jgi:hypothetical protein
MTGPLENEMTLITQKPIRSFGEGPPDVELEYRNRLRAAVKGYLLNTEPSIFAWPFNKGIMKNSDTRITSYHTEALPGIAIHATPNSKVRSPSLATIETVAQQPNGLYAVVLSSKNTNLELILGHISKVEPQLEAILEEDTYNPQIVREAEVLGQLGEYPNTIIELIVAKKRVGTDKLQRSDMLDPLPLLQLLYPTGIS